MLMLMRRPLLVLLAALGGAALMVRAGTVRASEITDYDAILQKWAKVYNVDWRLLKAHAMVESALNHRAVNPSDPSYGLMQVLCDAAGPDSPCRNRFVVDGWSEATPNRLLDPDFCVRIAAQIVAYNVRTFGMPRAVAVYNRWAERLSPPGGPFSNQRYVDKVLRIYRELGGEA